MQAIIVLNSGSSSLKFALFEAGDARPRRRLSGVVAGIGGPQATLSTRADGRPAPAAPVGPRDHAGALALALDTVATAAPDARLVAAGHRVVHGGARYHAPLRVDGDVLAGLRALVPLAPLHQPHNVAGIEALAVRHPDLPQVACFDTAFHHDLPAVAQATGLPWHLGEAGVRRYGFHGLACEAVLARMRERHGPTAARQRLVLAHLGHGASMTAVHDGRPVDTTMGFSALDGLPMGTRCGALDPGIVLHLLRERGMDPAALERLLYAESGLLGVSGTSADMRELLGNADDPRATAAVDLFCYRAVLHAGALAAALGGLDALVFSGGIGEHAAPVRARICAGLAHLGLALDAEANARHAAVISTPGSRLSVHVVAADEESVIAAHAAAVVGV